MTDERTTFWGRARYAAAERLGQGAAFLISLTAALAALSMAGRAPEFSAILFGAGLIALAIYKRPPTTIQQHFRVEAMTLNDARLGLDAGLALHVLDLLGLEARREMRERRDQDGGIE